jgi:hypothetical protein
VPQTFCLRTSGGFVDVTGFTVSGSYAREVIYEGTGIPRTVWRITGSDFRFKPLSGFVPAGVIFITVTINQIQTGNGSTFGMQATGAVGP